MEEFGKMFIADLRSNTFSGVYEPTPYRHPPPAGQLPATAAKYGGLAMPDGIAGGGRACFSPTAVSGETRSAGHKAM
jgi:hypothetical protein